MAFSHSLNSTLVILTYWIPLVVCSIVYIVRCIELYKKDLIESEKEYYNPKLTIGYIVGYIFYAITPCVNLFACVFDCMGAVFSRLGKIFDIPLVKKKKK